MPLYLETHAWPPYLVWFEISKPNGDTSTSFSGGRGTGGGGGARVALGSSGGCSCEAGRALYVGDAWMRS